MSANDPLPYDAALDAYEQRAELLLRALQSDDRAAAWRFKWEHPRFRAKDVSEVRPATLDIAEARMVVAREYGFEDWSHLAAFGDAVANDPRVARFEAAVDAVVSGDLATLRALLGEHAELVRARSMRRHHATLLHYIGANGVEGDRQKTPANAVEIAKLLLNAGSEVDALADMYDERCTTMSMLVSSTHPYQAGLQGALAETLLDHGAALQGPGSKWRSPLRTALAFGYLHTAETLAKRGAPIEDVAIAAGLGRIQDTERLLPSSDSLGRHIALALAAQHGHVAIVKLLLDAGEDPNRYNPDGYHAHSTPLHQAIASNHAAVVSLLLDRGARMDIEDTIYHGTPLDWAIYCERPEIAELLRGLGATTT